MTHTLFAKKQNMTEAYLGDSRLAVTKLELFDTEVVGEKSVEKEGYAAQVVSFGPNVKHPTKAALGKLKSTTAKKYLREIELNEEQADLIPGTLINVQATSKGKGNAGVMKRWGFAGGPRTHGQSDRARAPGSIGQGTTPGRVLKGRHMAGRMGQDTVTVRNLVLVAYDNDKKSLWVSGPVPGTKGSIVKIMLTSKVQKLAELKYLRGYSQKPTTEAVASSEEVQG